MENTKKYYYSPRFSSRAVGTIRRLAWALGVTMPKAIVSHAAFSGAYNKLPSRADRRSDQIVGLLPSLFASSVICPKCLDKSKCNLCGFNTEATAENASLSA
jgi:hypothetical protein